MKHKKTSKARQRDFYKDPKKEYIKKFRLYPPFLYHRLDAWLAKMSRNGWHVVHCAGFFFWFEKGLPEEKEYFTYGMASQEGKYSIELRHPSLEKTYGVPRKASKINANEAKSYHIVEIDRNILDTSKHVGYRELIHDRNRLYRRYFIRILIALIACISILVALSLFLP